MDTDVAERIAELFGAEPYEDYHQDFTDLCNRGMKRHYVGKCVTTLSVDNVLGLLCTIDNLTTYEVGRLFPGIVYRTLVVLRTDVEQGSREIMLLDCFTSLLTMVNEDRKDHGLERAFRDILDHDKSVCLLDAIGELIVFFVTFSGSSHTLIALANLHQLVCFVGLPEEISFLRY